eukprot:Gb_34242 [translate_table: standard]
MGVQPRAGSDMKPFFTPAIPATDKRISYAIVLYGGYKARVNWPEGTSVPPPSDATKQTNLSVPRSNGVPPKPASSLASTGQISEPASAMHAADACGEVSRAAYEQPFAFQFGSLSPVFMNAMQIPARTSSAPPNLDEQKHNEDQLASQKARDNLEPPVQGRRYFHSSGLPLPLAQQHPVSGGGSAIQFQQTLSPSIAVQIQYSAPSSQVQFSGTPPRPPPSLQSPTMHSHQGLMHQGQHLKFAQPMLPPRQVMPQHLNPITSQLSSQQLAHMAHHVGSQMGVPVATTLQGGVSGTQFGPPVINQYITQRSNRAVKITHPETHEELKFDSKGKESDSLSDSGAVTSSPVAGTLPGRVHANGSPRSRSPVALTRPHPTNFYPMQTVSYGHSSPTLYQPPNTSVPTGSLSPSSIRCNYVQPSSEQNSSYMSHSGVSTQLLVTKAGHDCPTLSVSAPADQVIVHASVPASSENHETNCTSIPSEDAHQPCSTSDLSCSAPLGSSKQGSLSADDGVSSPLKYQDIENLGSSCSVVNELSVHSCDSLSSVAYVAIDGSNQSTACISGLVPSMPVVDAISSGSAVSAPKAGSKICGDENHKGESVKASGPSTRELSKKMKKKLKLQQRKASSELAKKTSGKVLEPPQHLDSVSAFLPSTSLTNSIHADERPAANLTSGKMTSTEEPFTETSLSKGMPAASSEQGRETLKSLTSHDLLSDQANAESGSSYRNMKIRIFAAQNTTDNLNLDNPSGEDTNLGSEVPESVSQDVPHYEQQTNSVTEFVSTPLNLCVSNLSAEKSVDVVDSDSYVTNRQVNSGDMEREFHYPEEILESATFVHGLKDMDLKAETLPVVEESIAAPDEAHDKPYLAVSQEFSLVALDEESTLEVLGGELSGSQPSVAQRSQINESTATGAGLRQVDSHCVKVFAARDMGRPSESSGINLEGTVEHQQVSSLPMECEVNELSDSVTEKVSADSHCIVSSVSRHKHTVKGKVENVPSVNNRQAGATASSGSGLKRGGSKKKKKKDCLAKADAASSTGDLYNAFKAPVERQEDVKPPDASEVAVSNVNVKALAKDSENEGQKELDDWEDVAELPSQNKETESSTVNQADALKAKSSESRKYTRDFLLTFRDQFRNLPEQFETRADIAELLLNPLRFANHLGETQTLPNPGRSLDRQLSGGSRAERHGGNLGNAGEDRRIKSGGYFAPSRDMRVEVGPGGPLGGFRPGQGMNPAILRNARGAPINPFITGTIPGGLFTQIPVPQGGFPRNNFDADRWHRAPASQKGLFSSPRTHLPAMHKAENKYEVGKVSDEEHSKQRQIKAILNKLTPQNFDKLFSQVKEVNIGSAFTLTGVISQIFDKALMEPTFCEMYAQFCVDLAADLPEFNENNEKVTFKRVLLNKCQEEFERGEREQAEADRYEEDDEVKISEEEREQIRVKARRRMLGNIRFIGELYKKSMLTERIMHECIKTLLGEYQNPDDEDVEALCKLMSTIGYMIDRSKAREHIDAYFNRMTKLSNNQKLSSRLRFMLKDVIDLRKNGWQQRRKVEGPKKIEDVHRDAVQERQAQVGRSSRGPNMGSSGRRLPMLPDYGSRGSGSLAYSSGQPMGQLQQIRGAHPQMGMRGFGGQDVRIEDRHLPEKGPMPIHLAHRYSDDISVALGPQGGLSRGMTGRGHVPLGRSALADIPPVLLVDNRRISLSLVPGHTLHGGSPSIARDEIALRTICATRPLNSLEKPLLERPGMQEGNAFDNLGRDFGTLESSFSKSGMAANPVSQLQGFSLERTQLSQERLRELSDMAIKEFYSARDMKEAVLCVEGLKAPWFHSNMVSQWVTDSFDRKDVERDFLAKLLIYLCKSDPYLLSCNQLIRGLEISLSSLEDTVVDAPRAPEFFGVILGKIVVADILSFAESARIIREGGIEPGSLIEIGLALDVIGSVLEVTRQEKGEAALINMYRTSPLQLEDFIPSDKEQREFAAFLEKKHIQCLYPVSNRGHA